MIILVKKIDQQKGYDYVEYDTNKNFYQRGNSAIKGDHYHGTRLVIKVNTIKELLAFEKQIKSIGAKINNIL